MARVWGSRRRQAVRERAEAARQLREAQELASYVDELANRCATEIETNGFGEAIRFAMRKRAA